MYNFLKNYLGTLLFIAVGYTFYSSVPYYQNFLHGEYSFAFYNSLTFKSTSIFQIVLALYVIFLIPFYWYYTEKSKARKIIEAIMKNSMNLRYKWQNIEKIALRAWIVKLFFAPLMIFWLTGHIVTLLNNIYYTYNNRGIASIDFLSFFNQNFFWTAFTFILFADVFFFTMGYLIEMPKLKNTIKSVEPTFLGWFVTLACYPPFNSYVTNIINWYSNDFPQFSNPSIHIGLNSLILILMGIYASASISLGWKASNLTNRGIVKTGMYKIVRHPAYIAKNCAWWIGSTPMLYSALVGANLKLFLLVILSLVCWSGLYFMRAITEEWHLSQDPEYRQYKKEVKWRFIPYIY